MNVPADRVPLLSSELRFSPLLDAEKHLSLHYEAARLKGIESKVAGDVDILLAPDLNSGNILYKTLIFLAESISAAVVMGASAPIVLTSRADSETSKLMSIALAAALG